MMRLTEICDNTYAVYILEDNNRWTLLTVCHMTRELADLFTIARD
jgi:hypothetical protein